MTSRVSCSASPARALSGMPRIAPLRRLPPTSSAGWRVSPSPPPDPFRHSGSTRRRLSRNDNESLTVVALRGKDIDAFLARPDLGRPIILLYGPDSGLVRERAEALLASSVECPHRPFWLCG